VALDERRDRLAARSECPDAGVLADYAENLLSPEERAAVERHMLECAECRAVAADTTAFLAEDARRGVVVQLPGTRRVDRRWAVVAGTVAAAAAVALAIRVDPSLLSRVGLGGSGNAALGDLVAAVGGDRYVDGRLTDFPYGVLRSATRGPAETGARVDLLTAASALEQRAQADPSAANLHASGVAQLQLRHVREAVDLLERARAADPGAVGIAVDLSVAYVDASAQLRVPDALPKALAILDEVLARSPELPEALFNRAVVLEHLDRRPEAADAWRAFLRVEAASPWAAEARERLQRLEPGNPAAVSVP